MGGAAIQDMMKDTQVSIKSAKLLWIDWKAVQQLLLKLLPDGISETDSGADAMKAVLGNLRAIPTKLVEIRNPFGGEHGKSASFQGLEERHAKLAVGSSITFVDFIWSTYENQKQTK